MDTSTYFDIAGIPPITEESPVMNTNIASHPGTLSGSTTATEESPVMNTNIAAPPGTLAMSTIRMTDDTVSVSTTQAAVGLRPRSGYDFPMYGLANGQFYIIHGVAIACLITSLLAAVIALVLSFRRQHRRHFFTKWSKSERFVVYLALCDGLYNTCHLLDHVHIVIKHDHVYPEWLCSFYGLNLALFMTAQNLMVNVIAVNAFVLICFGKNLDFGTRDWRILVWTFGVPLLAVIVAAVFKQFGPVGAL